MKTYSLNRRIDNYSERPFFGEWVDILLEKHVKYSLSVVLVLIVIELRLHADVRVCFTANKAQIYSSAGWD